MKKQMLKVKGERLNVKDVKGKKLKVKSYSPLRRGVGVCILFLLFTFHLSLFTVAEAIYLGEFKAGTAVFYGASFNNDQGTIENPTSPEVQQRTPAGVWSDLTTPAIQNSKTGFYGGTIDTTDYAVGQYIIRLAGTVTTAKTIATIFSFTIVANVESDTYDKVNAIPINPLLTDDTRLDNLDDKISDVILGYEQRFNSIDGLIGAIPAAILVDPDTDKIDGSDMARESTQGNLVEDFTFLNDCFLIENSEINDLIPSKSSFTTNHLLYTNDNNKFSIIFNDTSQNPRVMRMIASYDPVTSLMTLDRELPNTPFNGDVFNILRLPNNAILGTDGKVLISGDEVVTTIEGSGDTAVDHNTGGVDNLRYVYQMQGIDNATIKVYLKTDYDAGNRSDAYVKARSKTKTDGRWQWPVYLDTGFTYSIIFYKQGIYGPTKKDVTIP
jgi:hypothetical protein